MQSLSTLLTSPDPLIHSLGWALIHSLWQGVLVACLLALVCRAVPGMSTRWRYALACAALLALVTLISITGIYHAWTYQGASVAFASTTIPEPQPGLLPAVG